MHLILFLILVMLIIGAFCSTLEQHTGAIQQIVHPQPLTQEQYQRQAAYAQYIAELNRLEAERVARIYDTSPYEVIKLADIERNKQG